MTPRITRLAAAAALGLAMGLPSRPLEAQTTISATPRDSAGAPALRHTELNANRSPAPLLDAPVSRVEYRLGAGDRLDVAIFGELNEVHTLAVTPEGSVLIPTVGIVRVLGLNLEQAEDRVRAAVARFYRNVEVRVALSQVRAFKVFVVGQVENPGVREATAATRVSEVVGSVVDSEGIRRRNVLVRRGSGDTVVADLARFVQMGDLSANPPLREGDAVVVSFIDRQVWVQGHVRFPGGYEYRANETLAELLTVANGPEGFMADAGDTVRVVRLGPNGERTMLSLSREQALGAQGRGIVMQPYEAAYVTRITNYRPLHYATITGQVVYQGAYPIRTDTTTVRELVAMAGGLTPQASLAEANLRRHEATRALQSELDAIPTDLLTREEKRILQTRASADPTRVVVDFQRLFAQGGDALDVPVRAGDVLTIPTRRPDVTVVGAVRSPGVVALQSGRGADFFVREAGGYTRRADRGSSVVIKARTGARVSYREAGPLEAGDVVVVPFREPLRWTEVIASLQGLVATASGLILTSIAVF